MAGGKAAHERGVRLCCFAGGALSPTRAIVGHRRPAIFDANRLFGGLTIVALPTGFLLSLELTNSLVVKESVRRNRLMF